MSSFEQIAKRLGEKKFSKSARQLILDRAVVHLLQGRRLEVQRGPLTLYMGSSSENRRDPFWYEHPGGRTYKETPLEVVMKVLPHVGFERLEKAKVYPS